ncbi:nuclear transport factor 2 family protein [Nostoc flagelliforme FACHB-838]|uniref:Nuclear transport factor 2 family protein n=1 Tax=Nostoc flagelliforme FACHB-838 TaxID=2692904 RepID=A0ABR8DZ85_9NOSO|nr:nuclear transport factor 2 family protein [Nostoc flagelliforme]MBD2534655.1 nuclear transport factor 2 family protein [Nostoc flagelliforme FACHB-838]
MNHQRRNILLTLGAGLTGFFSSTAIATARTKSPTQANTQVTMNTATLQKLVDRTEIIDAVNIIGMGADLRDWKACRAAFADKVFTDYTSLNGGTSNTVVADTLVAGWADFFSKTFKATQHMITNHAVIVNGDKATCTSNFRAHHVYLDGKSGKTWTLGGFYNHGLTRINGHWKVTQMKMTWTYEEGNRPS